MSYLAWGIFAEGPTDYEYLEVIIPKLLDDIVARNSNKNITISAVPAIRLGRGGRSIEAVSQEICETMDAYHLLFVHGDTGGRAQAVGAPGRIAAYSNAALDLCNFPPSRCVSVQPRHEIEAWALCDSEAVLATVGFHGDARDVGLPTTAQAAENLVDPKAILVEAIASARGRRRSGRATIPHAAIAQRQSLALLRNASSFRDFEAATMAAIQQMGWVFA